jgi:hypothetical protein
MFKEGLGIFSKYMRYEVGNGLRCGFGMVFEVESRL